MVASTTGFRPQSHGFKFVNRFTIHRRIPLPLGGSVDLGDLVIGLCGGMCFTALDCYHSGVPIPSHRTVPQVGSKLYRHLVTKQVESLIPPDGVFKVLIWTAKEDGYVWRHTAGTEFRKLRSRLDKRQPAVLALIRVRWGEDPGLNHQVVARAYDYDEQSGKVAIMLYDPNHPGKEPRLTMSVAQPLRGINAKESTGERLRGFFVIDYKPGKPPVLRQ